MASLNYTNYKGLAMKGSVALLTDTLKCALMTASYTPNQDTDTFFGDINTNEASGTGYTAGGMILASPSVTADNTNHRYLFNANNVSWPSSTLSNIRYAVIYKSTGVPSTSPLIALVDFGSNQSSAGDTFSIDWSTSPAGIFYLA